MNKPPSSDSEVLRRAASKATRDWAPFKRTMALRAAGIDSMESRRASLDAIAAELGVSRETVRRARNELIHLIEPSLRMSDAAASIPWSLSVSKPTADSPATVRALRRLLTMTGPLRWDEVLSAWARAGGKAPFSTLPADLTMMRAWASKVGGFILAPRGATPTTIGVARPEKLDRVGQFLFFAVRGELGGVDRGVLLASAEQSGLKATTVATALSSHPAVMRVGRGTWALRGHRESPAADPPHINEPRRSRRVRPTAFSWSREGSLRIEFSLPYSPSPVIAIPKAVSAIVEGREFGLQSADGPAHLSVRNARLWGFGASATQLGLIGGARATIAMNLLEGTAKITAARGKDSSRW